MKSTNLFSDFLINSEAFYFSMQSGTNCTAFVDFFGKTQYCVLEDNQIQLLEVETPMFAYDKGVLYALPDKLVSSRIQGVDLTPGDLVQLDWYKDAFVYKYHPQTWCLPDTFKLLSNLDLELIGQSIRYRCKLVAIDGGFLKQEYMWKRTTLTNLAF